jgi:4-amino-4-deoxy-L-arabinose transferase-like glycosyltransferase
VVIVVTCSLLYTLARRLGIGRPLAAGAVIVFTCSPVALWFHRLVLLDNFAVAWILAAFVLALSPRRRLWALAGSGACFAAAFLSKETAFVFLPALLLAVAQNADRRMRRYALTVSACCATLIAATYPLYAVLKGELLPGKGHVSLLGEEFVQLVSRKGSGSIFAAHSLAHGTVQFWLKLDPWLLVGALIASPIALARRTSRPIAFCFLFQVALLLRPGYLPQMYVIGLLPFAALMVATSAEVLWRLGFGALSGALGAGRRLGRLIAARGPNVAARGPIVVSILVLVIAAVLSATVIGPSWVRADRQALAARPDASQRAAEEWLVRNIDHTKRLIVDDNTWVYLINHGFDASPVRGGFYSRTVVFYWPLDYDPAVQRLFPQGWRDFDYVVSTLGMRNDGSQTPTARDAIQHSFVLASFGTGNDLVEIREIIRTLPQGGVTATGTAA